jgi:hypothetical protein
VLAGTVGEAAIADIVAIAVPWPSVPAAVAGLSWNGQVVMDATNAFKADLGGRTSSEIVVGLMPGARLVKAANTLAAAVLGADPHEADGRRVIFLSGDDAPAKAAVAGLFDAAGFFPIDLGGLVTGGRLQQVGGPLPSHNLVRLPPVSSLASRRHLVAVAITVGPGNVISEHDQPPPGRDPYGLPVPAWRPIDLSLPDRGASCNKLSPGEFAVESLPFDVGVGDVPGEPPRVVPEP